MFVVVSMHMLEQHWLDPLHTRPHAPQFATDDVVSMQLPLQQVSVVPQLGLLPHMQTPAGEQVSPVAHAGEHVAGVMHVEPTHTSPEAHAMLQPPQLFAFVFVFTHVPLQHVAPLAHAEPPPQWHAPPLHVSPDGHVDAHVVAVSLPASNGGAYASFAVCAASCPANASAPGASANGASLGGASDRLPASVALASEASPVFAASMAPTILASLSRPLPRAHPSRVSTRSTTNDARATMAPPAMACAMVNVASARRTRERPHS
jgi:hypothetical protein